MGYLKYVKKLWQRPKENMPELWRERLIAWRKQPATLRIDRPTRIDRARSLGYKAKPGIIMVRQKLGKGGRQREQFKAGRRPKTMRRTKIVGKNYQQVAEERANEQFKNCEVLNSYWVAEDGQYKWFEIILVDRDHPQTIKSKNLHWISTQGKKGRASRGLTSAGRKSRGLYHKGKGAEKIRPSQRANNRLAK